MDSDAGNMYTFKDGSVLLRLSDTQPETITKDDDYAVFFASVEAQETLRRLIREDENQHYVGHPRLTYDQLAEKLNDRCLDDNETSFRFTGDIVYQHILFKYEKYGRVKVDTASPQHRIFLPPGASEPMDWKYDRWDRVFQRHEDEIIWALRAPDERLINTPIDSPERLSLRNIKNVLIKIGSGARWGHTHHPPLDIKARFEKITRVQQRLKVLKDKEGLQHAAPVGIDRERLRVALKQCLIADRLEELTASGGTVKE